MDSQRTAELYGVGLGPGDPGLVTLAAMSVLETAEIIIAPSSHPESMGRAEYIVHTLLPDREVIRIPMQMASGSEGIDRRLHAVRETIRELRPRLTSAAMSAFVTLGDPLLYSTFSLVVEAVVCEQLPIAVRVIPGVPAFLALASLVTTNLLDNDERLHLVPATGDPGHLEHLLEDRESVLVIYKLSSNFAMLRAMIAQAGRQKGAMVGLELGTDRMQVLTLSEAPDRVPYFATIIVPVQRRSA
ncbi:precorrin-2 C(20)-methyltransferase [Ferrimicrobium acidiphilum]|uniref:precorrin-2 C(20)-methyltransferase n=1 Tax=Ferrimicrobium acidiphilum TaxID=121039 RepID=UPI0023F37726|nr:precorrin-2 C(20)-methyltransferase [Ferrimicrobium acidiphilum]